MRLARDLVPAMAVVLVNSLYGGQVLNIVTDDWARFDLTIVQREDLPRYADSTALTAIFNKGDAAPPARPRTPARASLPDQLLTLVKEFLRVIGLTPVAMGREAANWRSMASICCAA